jgi:hypothetical protein
MHILVVEALLIIYPSWSIPAEVYEPANRHRNAALYTTVSKQ